MLIFDIIILLILFWAVYRGFKDGIAVQLCGLAGLVIGIWLAGRFGRPVGDFFGLDAEIAAPVGFLIVLVVIIIVLALLGRLLKGILSFAGLGMLDKAGGVLLSVAKAALVVGCLLYGFDSLNETTHWVANQTLAQSRVYTPLISTVKHIIPYAASLRDVLATSDLNHG